MMVTTCIYLATSVVATITTLSIYLHVHLNVEFNPHLLSFLYLQESDYPTVLIALFVEQATPFLREFFQRVALLDYPKDKIDVYVHNNVCIYNCL